MYINQFIEVPTSNNDLEDLNCIRNLAYFDNKYWFVSWKFAQGSMHIYSTDSISGVTTPERNIGYYSNISQRIIKIWDNDIYGGCYGGTTALWSRSSDGGSSWANNGFVRDDPTYIVDFIRFSNGAVYVLVAGLYSGTNYVWIARSNTGTTWEDLVVINNPNEVYSGYTNFSDNTYHFLYRDASGDLQEGIFTQSTLSLSVGTTDLSDIIAPNNYNINNQQFWQQGNYEIIMDEDHLYQHKIGETSWRSIEESGTSTNGIVWGHDENGNLIIKYIFFKDACYKMLASGLLERLQNFTDSAYTGWENWIANGSDTLYQIEESQTYNSTTFSISNVVVNYFNGTMKFFDYSTTTSIWSQDQYLSAKTVWNSTTYDLFEGKVKSIKRDNLIRKEVTVESLWVNDLKTSKVSTTYIGQTADTIMVSVVNNFCSYCTATTSSIGTTTYSITYENNSIEDILRTLCQAETWKWFPTIDNQIIIGTQTTTSAISFLVDQSSNYDSIRNLRDGAVKQSSSRIELIGGYSGANRVKANYATTNSVSTFIYRDFYPEITTTAELLAIAQKIAANYNQEIIQIEFECYNKPPAIGGYQYQMQYTPYSSTIPYLGTKSWYYSTKSGYREDGNVVSISLANALFLEKPENDDGVTSKKLLG